MNTRICFMVAAAVFAAQALTGCSDSRSVSDAAVDAMDASPSDSRTTQDGAADASADADVWVITPGCNPLAVTNECMLPYPSDFLTVADPSTPTGLRFALPANALTVPRAATAIDMTPFNRTDGAPTSSPILVHFGVDVDPSFLADQTHTAMSLSATSPIALINATTGERVPFLSEMDANVPTRTTRHVLIIRPLAPLEFDTRYVVAISNTLRDTNGSPLPQSRGFAALRDGTPTSFAVIENARSHYEQIFTSLATAGYARNSLLLAWDYTTASNHAVIGPITALRQAAFAAGADAGIPYTIDSVTPSTSAPGANIVEGSFTPPNFLQADNTIQYGADGIPIQQTTVPAPSYPYTMIVPPQASGQSLALVLFGHGLFGAGRDYLTTSFGSTIQPLAQSFGAVVVATDWIGLSSGDLQLIIDNVVPDLNRIGIVTDRLLQSLVNNLSLIELSLGALQSDPMVRMSPTQALIDRSRVFYYGVSLGGIEGSSLISVSRNVTRAAVAVPGASWSNLLARSYDYRMIKTLLDVMYPDPLLQQEFITLMQIRFDPVDPVNLATLFQRHPLPDAPAQRTVVIQESIGDCQVPNLTTEILVRAYGFGEITPDLVPIFGVNTVTAPLNTSALSQFELQADYMTYIPPMNNVLPTMDNGVHSDLAFRPPVLDQVTQLFTTGQIVQNCPDAGACLLP